MARKEMTWEPTQDGQAVLYGVPGPSYDTEKYAKGYRILFDAQRDAIAKVFDENCQVREQRVNQQDAWAVRFFPKDKRGQWRAEAGEVVLLYNEKEIARGFDEGGRAKLPDRFEVTNAAAAFAGEAAAA